ncbi:MAG: ATP-binding cassette domain-containing protein [Clostridiales Family XIII bacterium]|nr:ATP-binding cassette domain-containing protein [Anaerovorax odorimutans]MCI7301743.1 ATP-binding cassette domain-containing protein [Clostridia bacterium]MDY3012256.1 ATP-binding cassette domain-containing protein [Clostridiales Family XIII bacterium]
MKEAEPIVRAEDVSYTYEDGTQALKGISLTVRAGERVAVMGANGSGKSTFFLHLNGILKPQEGRIFIGGKPIDYSRKGLLEVRKKVGIVFQNPDNQLFSASVKQEISFGILNLGASETEAEKQVEQVMEELEINPFAHKPTHFLSGGQKKRVSIADILVMGPELILLDEPAAALDPKHARMIDGIVDQLSRRGITILLSTHDVERALIWADRVVLFDEGVIAGEGSPEEIFRNDALLKQTNLEKPTVFQIFDTLCEEGILDPNLDPPHRVEELTAYIRQKGIDQL